MDLSKLSDAELQALYAQAKKTAGPQISPMDGIPWWQAFAEGGGKAVFDIGRGLGQLTGAVSREDVDAAKKQDASLMDSSGGFWGNIAGNVVPALAMPASTLPRALATGVALGAAQPVGTGDSRTENALIGGIANAAFPVAGAAYRGVRSMVEPFMAPGKTAARVIEQFADNPAAMRAAVQANAVRDAQGAITGMKELVPGAKPTLAEVAQQPGISTLQRGMANQPGPLQNAITGRVAEQNAARLSYLDDLAGADGRLDFSKASRSTAADELYAKAFAEVPEDSKWIKGEVTKLTQRPAFVSALKDGQEMAMNLGIKVTPDNPENATQILHFTKMALDDKIEAAARAGNGNQSRALIDTRDKLVSLMESKGFSPSYREARDTFKQMSQPINEMELAGKLRDKLVPSLNQVTNTTPTKLYADSLAGEVKRNAGDLARMSPDFQGKVGNLTSDLQRRAAAESLGKSTGSPTAQYLTTQNLMRQTLGPLGLPQGAADKAAGWLMGMPGVGTLAGAAMKGPEQRVQQEVANLLLNPSQVEPALARLHKLPGPVQQRLSQAYPYLPAIATSGMFAYGR